MIELRKRGAATARKAWAGVTAHRRSLDVLLPLLGVILIIDIMTFSAGFGSNDDPGTYTAQAWAVINRGDLAHYTYWYDHPPAGWLQIALYAWLTDGFGRSSIDVLMAGELMVVAQLIGCALIFMFMRRLNFNRAFAALAVVLFALSPLAIYFQKMAFLDNLAVTWVIAGMVLAVSPRRSLGSAFGAGLCMAVAILTKETAALWVPVVAYLLWQTHGRGHRAWSQALFFSSCIGVGFLYLLYAVLKGELIPGPGHVSLYDALVWQLTRKAAGGDTASGWLALDRWLLYAGAVALVPGLIVRRLRPVALGFGILVAMVLRGGYVPAPLVIGMLPFAAVLVAGSLGTLWPHRDKLRESRLLSVVRAAAVLAVFAGALGLVAPHWVDSGRQATSRAEVVYYQDTLDWIEKNVPKDAVIAVDDNTWVDLYQAGYKNVVWFYKLDLDPAVQKKYVPDGYKGIDFIAMKRLYFYIARDSAPNSVISQAANNSEQVAEFGDPGRYSPQEMTNLYVVYKVKKDGKKTNGAA